MLVGATTGFLISRRMKTSLGVQILSALGGSLILGVPYLLVTRKKDKNNKTVYIQTKDDKITVDPNLIENKPTPEQLNQVKQTLKMGGLIK